ncbi:PQQ-dependent sugar dehydrogenase [Subsaximicrobium wynnwilliamsii]|uniref:PQQ-dependent sugar dehydrogenase n=1 Tax=Subsaximicrobium wynnwilliamsii TaxID=291179 RepID=A0A5C6ZMQ7_9FLAO|nr:PQQ-dependent sugar dehydrogenase [Subsaximicrobium wynnwilliamsii]TXD85076.1 PQQ-dependent sugar dehydrogenase [Subsaximicrobium wynnwilliamsii]TXD91119.1 PQQ-dependent sugar dehydrogenase [Subsaximicrobium wynnwilliamsii]TXE04513.1 PQQ-dependent sugar dehydrogenase [Subsaximicrobium wynnwilliamsii]
MNHRCTLSVLASLLLWSLLACAQDKNPINTKNSHEVVVPDLSIPWGFCFLPDGAMLITEKEGELIHFKDGKKTQISGIPEVYNRGQGGLMDIKLHPDYKDNDWIYLTYASSEGEEEGGNTALMRAKLKDNALVEQEILYKATPNTTRGQHFGSRIVFDDDGYLFFTIGERGNRDENPQDISRDGGKVYRLNDDGSIPDDNPFVNTPNAKKAIYSYGHRNQQGMVINPTTQAIWAHEHGPKGGDEINIVEAGKNYGWPVITYGVNYSGTTITDETSRPNMAQPLYYWVPSIAPSGMEFISSDVYEGWKGNLLVGSLKFQYLDNCYIKDNKVVKQERLLDGLGRVRSINQGPDGFIYVGIENLGIVKLIQTK